MKPPVVPGDTSADEPFAGPNTGGTRTVSEDPDIQADEAEVAQGAAEPEGSPAPWGDDFNPDRAWKTITHLRGREKELEQQARELEALRSDPDRQRQFLAELGYELPEDEPDPDPDIDPDPTAELRKELEDLKSWRQEQQSRENLAAFTKHVEQLSEGAEVSLTEREKRFIAYESAANGLNPKATEQAFKEVLEEREALKRQTIEGYAESKKAPRPPQQGRAATETKNILEMSDQERIAYMKERFQNLQQAS